MGLLSSSSSIGKDRLVGRRSPTKLRTWMTSKSITNGKARATIEGASDRGSISSIRESSRRLSSLNNTMRSAATLHGRLRGTKTQNQGLDLPEDDDQPFFDEDQDSEDSFEIGII